MTLQLLLVLPLMILGTLAVLQFALTSVVEGGVRSAARAGADVASRGGGMPEVLAAIESVLATHGVNVPVQSGPARGNLLVLLESPERPEVGIAGNPAIQATPSGPRLRRGEVRVTVCIQLTGGPGDPVPNWLRFAGFSLQGYQVLSSSLAVRETAREAALVSQRVEFHPPERAAG
ncbi:MAG: hypothetical protein WD069_00640 [Planctomycetales bacterium]